MKDYVSKVNVEWALSQWLRLRGNKLARNAGYLVLAAVAATSNAVQLVITGIFAVFNVKLQVPDTPWWIFLLFIAAAAFLLAFDRCVPEKAPQANPKDIELLKQIRALFTPDMQYFLRQHDFHERFERSLFKPIGRISDEWQGAQYEFLDESMQAAWNEVRQKARTFCCEVSLHTWVDDFNFECQTPYPRGQEMDDPSPLTRQNIRNMNEAAEELVAAIDAFENLARKRLPSA